MTSTSEQDWQWIRDEVRSAAEAFGHQLRGVPDGTVRVPNLEWTVSELAAHLVSLPENYRRQNALTEPFETPSSWPEFSRQARSHITEAEPSELADMLESEIGEFLDELTDGPGAARTLYNVETTDYGIVAALLGELLMHGLDLAALTNAQVTIDRRQANAIVDHMMILAPAFVDRDKARKCPGTFHLRFRGGNEYTYRVNDGVLAVERGRPKSADAHIVADPKAFMLVAMGRMSDVKAGLLGKIVGYGRKPWLLIPLGKVRVDGV